MPNWPKPQAKPACVWFGRRKVRGDLAKLGVAARLKSDRAVAIARRLRKSMTPAERALWAQLRWLSPKGSHFRRQTPVGPFVVDFACHGARLVIELDGGAHHALDVEERDVERQRFIEGRGYRVLRFQNAHVLREAGTVARYIFAEASIRMAD